MATIQVRVDDSTKAAADSLFAALGMDMSTVINIFLGQVVRKEAMPFMVTKPAAKCARLGGWEGKIQMSSDFNEPMDEFKDYVE